MKTRFRFEKFGVTSQLRRTAVSVFLNIDEKHYNSAPEEINQLAGQTMALDRALKVNGSTPLPTHQHPTSRT
jgi:uncharacterized protein (UPF0297 family)